MIKKLKTPLVFTLIMFPVSLVAGVFSCLYQMDLYSEEMMAEAIAQLGSVQALIAVSAIQSGIYGGICAFFGAMMAEKIALWKPIKLEKKPVLITLGLSLIFGVIFSLDYWVFGGLNPIIKESTQAGLTPVGVIASVLYGGIVEELMLRLMFITLLATLTWKLFFRKYDKKDLPKSVFIIANIAAALVFAAGHLPATYVTFGELSVLILFRCFLLNGGFGLFFGWLYRKYGIVYAMMGHILLHLVSKLIWFIFI